MSRTFKDLKEEKAKRLNRQPQFKRRYRVATENGFAEDSDCETCPECGAAMNFEGGYLSCEDCNWGSYANENDDITEELEFSDVA